MSWRLSMLKASANKDGMPEYIPTHKEKAEWFPYPSKVMFLLNTIDNLPRQRISSTLMKVILWLLSEVGVKHVPSFDMLRTFQKSLREDNGIATTQWKSSKGNVFSFNDPQALILNVREHYQTHHGLEVENSHFCKGLGKSFDMSAYTSLSCHSTERCHLRNMACAEVAPPSWSRCSQSYVWCWEWSTLLYWWACRSKQWRVGDTSPVAWGRGRGCMDGGLDHCSGCGNCEFLLIFVHVVDHTTGWLIVTLLDFSGEINNHGQ